MNRDGAVLRDPELDRRLRRDGFVKFRIAEPAEVAGLRDAFLAMRGTEGEGFQSDLVSTDVAYRRDADRTIGEALDDRVVAQFSGYEPFLHNFLCKYPGGDNDLYLHQDWMYVDERKGLRSYVAWVALEDIDGPNGQLQVLRSSHDFPRSPRGTQLTAPWLAHEDVIRTRLLTVPVKAGECLVFDNALVHSSLPNLTDEPRVAAAVGMAPIGAQLVHFVRHDERSAELHHVTRDFFLEETPQALWADGLDADPVEVLSLPKVDMDARSLARMADRPPLARLDQAYRALAAAKAAPAAGVARAKEAAAARKAKAAATEGPSRAERARERSTTALASAKERAAHLRERSHELAENWPSLLALGVLHANEWTIDHFGPPTVAVWDPDSFAWSERVERAWPEVRAEVEALLHGPTEIPHIEDVTGGIPQGNEGPWRSFVLMHQGKWIDWNCARCPRTTELVRTIPGLTLAGFSVLEPGTHITEHRGPNKGALRYQLGVVVPGDEGDCRIRVGDEMLIWREGEGVAFDFTVPHEAWNDSDGIRVLLMLEVLAPLPWYLDRPNRLAQKAMGWFPTTRDMKRRLKALEPTLSKPPAAA